MNNINPTPLDEYGEVLDVKHVFWKELKKRKKRIIMLAAVAFVWALFCLIIMRPGFTLSIYGFWLVVFPLIFLFLWLAIIYSGIRKAFWQQLATKYGWEYSPLKDISDEKGLLFAVGNSEEAYNGIKGEYKNHPFHIFEYSYTVGSGKHKSTYSFTVFEIKFTGTFPHLYLNYKGDWHSNAPSMFSELAKITLPSEFENKFKLYSPKEYEIETLQIFTPEIFALLLDSKWNHDMEFVNGELVIYRKKRFNSFTELDAELAKIKKFIDILSPLLNRFKLAQIGDISHSLER